MNVLYGSKAQRVRSRLAVLFTVSPICRHIVIPFDPTIFNADFKPPEAAFIEKSWETNGNASWLNASLGWTISWIYSSASSARGTKL